MSKAAGDRDAGKLVTKPTLSAEGTPQTLGSIDRALVTEINNSWTVFLGAVGYDWCCLLGYKGPDRAGAGTQLTQSPTL